MCTRQVTNAEKSLPPRHFESARSPRRSDPHIEELLLAIPDYQSSRQAPGGLPSLRPKKFKAVGEAPRHTRDPILGLKGPPSPEASASARRFLPSLYPARQFVASWDENHTL